MRTLNCDEDVSLILLAKMSLTVFQTGETSGEEETCEEREESSEEEETKGHKCNICHSHFPRKYHLRLHMNRKHAQNINKFVCPLCGQLSGEIPMMRVHLKRFHQDEKRLITKKAGRFVLGKEPIKVISISKKKLKNGRFYGKITQSTSTGLKTQKRTASSPLPAQASKRVKSTSQSPQTRQTKRKVGYFTEVKFVPYLSSKEVIVIDSDTESDEMSNTVMAEQPEENEDTGETTPQDIKFVEMPSPPHPNIKNEQPHSFLHEFISFTSTLQLNTTAMTNESEESDESDNQLFSNRIKIEPNTAYTATVPTVTTVSMTPCSSTETNPTAAAITTVNRSVTISPGTYSTAGTVFCLSRH